MIYELRIYHCTPGKLPVVIDRFKDTSVPLWEKIGIQQVGFFTTLIGPSNQTLTYILEWESLAERERLWDIFVNHPDLAAKRSSYANDGVIVERVESSFLTPTSFSALR